MAEKEYIEREAAISEIDNMHQKPNLIVVRERIAKIPAADVQEVRHGKWLPQALCGQRVFDCSECKTLGSPAWKWCLVCGAKMDGKGDA